MDDEQDTRVLTSKSDDGASIPGESFVDGQLATIARLGRYRLLERVGRGAFGTVWAAYDPDLDRKVAIKFVLRRHARGASGSTSASQGSLIGEAQSLAQLANPNVVTIHDVGRLEQVQPELDMRGVFIVMEFLAGPTLHAWLGTLSSDTGSGTGGGQAPASEKSQARRRSESELLAAFLGAGRGLAAAHARGIAHLDFKASNAMFGEDGRIRVLDFGLARVAAQRDASKVAGTPVYMAPEQHLGQPADARADQYAFCASLWHALYGAPPFGERSHRKLASLKLSTTPTPPRDVSVAAHVHAVLERGLAARPEHRFEGMEQLLAALADDPIQRRRRRVLGVGLLAATLAAGFGLSQLSSRQNDPCALEAGTLAGIWDADTRARTAASFTATGASFAGESLREVERLLDLHLGEWQQVRGELCRAALVEGHTSVERMGEQMLCLDRQLRRVAELSRHLAEADAELVARAQASVRELDEPRACSSAGGESIERELLGAQARRELLLPAETKIAAAEVAELLGRYEPGLLAADEAVSAASSLDDALTLARAHGQRSRLLRQLGRLDEALTAQHDALEAVAQPRAGTARETQSVEAGLLVEAVSLYAARGDFDTAVAFAQLAHPRVSPERSPKLAAALREHAGTALFRLQRWDESLVELEAGIEQAEASFGVEHPMLAPLYIQLANVLSESNRAPEQALRHYEHAIALWTAAYGARHPVIGRAQLNLAGIHYRRGDTEATIVPLEQALQLFAEVYPPGHPTIGVARQNLGAMQYSLGNYDAALPYFERSAQDIAAKLGAEHPEYATAARNLASVLVLLGRPHAARAHFDAARGIYAGALEPGDNRLLLLAAEQAEVAWWLGDGEAFARHVAEVEASLDGAELNDPRRLSPVSVLIMAALASGERERALALAESLVAFMSEQVGPDHLDCVRARVQLGEVLRVQGRHQAARVELERSLEALGREGREHPSAWMVRLELGALELAQGRAQPAAQWLEPAREALAPGLLRAIVELSLARALVASDRAQARAWLESAGPVIRAEGPRAELLEQLVALERELGSSRDK